MAELTPRAPASLTGQQLRAIAGVRWRLLANSMRTTRGALELVSHLWVGFWFGLLGLGAAVGAGAAGWYFATHGELEWLAVLLWVLFLFWQGFPLAASAFTEQTDTSNLLRFPLRYPAYVLVRIVFGAVGVETLVGGFCLLGMVIGIGIARPGLLAGAALAALLFAAFNILLAQMIFAWLERWLARRRTREILALGVLLLLFSINFIRPLIERLGGARAEAGASPLARLLPLARWLPPGLPAHALAAAASGRYGVGAAGLLLLAAWGLAALALLHLRLRAEYRGETLMEAAGRAPAALPPVGAAGAGAAPAAAADFGLPGVGGPVGAVARKELRYLARSPMMFFSLVMPVVLLVLFHFQFFAAARPGRHPPHLAGLGFPIGVAYALLVMSNLIFNCFGTDAAGVQFYFVSPVAFRQILLGKNLASGLILAAEAVALYLAATVLDGPPAAWVLAATVLGLGFGALCDFACGNLLSLYMPKKIDLSRLGRQGGRGTSGLAALAVQGLVIGLAAIAVVGGRAYGHPWLAVLILALLVVAAGLGYLAVLGAVEPIAQGRRETLIAELSKA
ncbi:MAG TPA: hypothetical protein VMV31_11270 [Terriglobales bacterium]|nr:hypothetical protein [Terriglobales bacterium]